MFGSFPVVLLVSYQRQPNMLTMDSDLVSSPCQKSAMEQTVLASILALELRQKFIVGGCVLALRHHFATSRDVVMGLVDGRHDQSTGLVVLGVLGKGTVYQRNVVPHQGLSNDLLFRPPEAFQRLSQEKGSRCSHVQTMNHSIQHVLPHHFAKHGVCPKTKDQVIVQRRGVLLHQLFLQHRLSIVAAHLLALFQQVSALILAATVPCGRLHQDHEVAVLV
mmetsp:Transcript_16388/g.27771  ORF Transcript_16388/g.27771 Transcript_16388/m.27771 type:complete len:220 (-) Transcript_16388:181-840(-)